MSAFRAEFFAALHAMLALCQNPLLIDTFPPSAPHNAPARILRRGLAVSAFAYLENYIKETFKHLADDLAQGPIQYAALPDKLRKFLLADAISGINTNLNFIRDENAKTAAAEVHIGDISKYLLPVPRYTSLGFSPTGSNVGHEDIKKGFAAFGVSDVWGKIRIFSSLIGASILSPQDNYKNLSNYRNAGAHNPTGDIPTSTLEDAIRDTITIGICIDLLAKQVGRSIAQCTNAAQFVSDVQGGSMSVRFVDDTGTGFWLERAGVSRKAKKKYSDKNIAVAGALARANTQAVILRSVSLLPLELHS